MPGFPKDAVTLPLAARARQIETLIGVVTNLVACGEERKAEDLACLIHELSDDLGEHALELTDWFAGREAP